MFSIDQYELLDFGDGRKLERFGSLVLDRVSPAADGDLPADPASWQKSHFRFQRQQGEQGQGTGLMQGGGVELALGSHPDALWRDVDAVVASPGIHPEAPPLRAARAEGITPVSEIELASAYAEAPAVAVSGSNGKSTVTSMVGAILAESDLAAVVCGNIGVPFSRVVRQVLQGERRVERYVLELSSFQTETIVDFRPRWAGLLNISADHLDRHGDLTGIVDCWPLDMSGQWSAQLGAFPVLRLIKALAAREAGTPRLFVVTANAQPAGGTPVTGVGQAAMWGLGRVLGHQEFDDVST